MSTSLDTPARSYFPGMGQAVADRTVNRKITRPDGTTAVETWADVAERVAEGNALLEPREEARAGERAKMRHHLRQASLLMSGRHLQHGDATQPTRPMEVFTNCSTSSLRCLTYRLLLNGSGVGSPYDDDMMVVDLNQMPIVVPVIDWGHADVQSGRISGYLTRRDAEHLYAGSTIKVHEVGDSREGWAKAVEVIERMAFQRRRNNVLLVDFTQVRPFGAPIRGMQNRPASGPGPMMTAIENMARLRDADMEPWRAALYADHYLAECVLVGGARRAARMATKTWRDKSVFGFIQVKRGGFLWSANNSVTIDEEFRERVQAVRELLMGSPVFLDAIVPNVDDAGEPQFTEAVYDWFTDKIQARELEVEDEHAWKVLVALAYAAYHDGTGEPGLISVDRLTQNDEGFDGYLDGSFVAFGENGMDEESRPMVAELAKRVRTKRYTQITNPCGEISLLMLGGYCVIADVVPFHAGPERPNWPNLVTYPEFNTDWDDDAEDAFRTATRALIRTNLMDCLYKRETSRTNRIGVGITGLHEWIFARFGLGFRDIIAEDPHGVKMLDANGQLMALPHPRALPMWLTLARFARAVSDEARRYSTELGRPVPHTDRTIKPAGTTSKLFGLTEGAHLPSMREFLRWVQFRNDDPLVATYEAKGYPVKRLKTYSGTTVVGFPTQPMICQLGMGDKLVTAAEATMEEQYRYLRLLETFWIRGVNEDLSLLEPETGNQVSYTAKYDPKATSYEDFLTTLIEGQFSVRCCSVMPQTDTTAYEYQPEQPVTKHEFEMIAAAIKADGVQEDIGFEHVDCGAGACPIDFRDDGKVSADTVVVGEGKPEFRVYAMADCPWCERAKALLNDLGVTYEVVDLSGVEQRQAFYANRGFTVGVDATVPKIYTVDGAGEERDLIGGYAELAAVMGK